MKSSQNTLFQMIINSLRENYKPSQLEGRFVMAMRKNLGMTIKELSERLKISPATVQQMEKRESKGNITIESMKKLAEAMNCEFHYVLIPKTDPNEFILNEAKKKAKLLLNDTQLHMELEDQKAPEDIVDRVEHLAHELIKKGKVWS